MCTPLGTDATTLVNQRTEPAPTYVGQPGQRIVRAPLVTKIDHERAALHRARVDKTPVAGVRGVVAVVPQHEILAHRNAERTPRIARRMIAPPLLVGPLYDVLALPVEFGIEPVVQWIGALHVRLFDRAPVPEHLPEPHLHDVPRYADHPFHVAQRRIFRVGEHDHVATVWRLEAG